MKEITRCKRCIMDNAADPTIRFDENGYCNYCTAALARMEKTYFPNEEGQRRLDALLSQIKKSEQDKQYDCIMGLSGGLDSSYLAYLGHKWGLRVLAVHLDDGYDTEISKSNLKKLIDATGFDYKVIQPNPKQFNALSLAYMKAGVPNLAVPQDNTILAFLYEQMRKYHITYFLSGGNFALECILQHGNSYSNSDVVNIKDIHRRFGTEPIDQLKFVSSIQRLTAERLHIYKTLRPLDLIDYNRDRAFQELADFCGFEYYGRKHLENIFTAFLQLYWFPRKFHVDKRTSHLSSMIVSGQISREQALKEYQEPLYDEAQMEKYRSIIKKGLGISDAEFEALMAAPPHQHTEYAVESDKLLYRMLRAAHRVLKIN